MGQQVKGFVTLKMIFSCSGYVTGCYEAVITGQGTPRPPALVLRSPLSTSVPLWKSHLLNTTSSQHLPSSPPPSFPRSVLPGLHWRFLLPDANSCQLAYASILPFNTGSLIGASLSLNSIQLDHSWTAFYGKDVNRWWVLLWTGQWLLNKELLSMLRRLKTQNVQCPYGFNFL